MNFLSPDGRCYSFDHRANGYARGEGFGILILKRLSTAIKDGDTIRALVRSTGVNQDGHTAGVTQPNKISQAELIRETYRKAELDMDETRFFEAHGKILILHFLAPTKLCRNRNCYWRPNRVSSYWRKLSKRRK
jgi:acyl transferase domain-containing protein